MLNTLPPRNSTNFPQSLVEAIKNISHTDDALRHHQVIVKDYIMENVKSRGALVYHKMGSGKTRIGTALADGLHARGYKVIFLSAKSLHENAKKDMRIYYRGKDSSLTDEQIDEIIASKFTFVSTKNRATVRKTLEGAISGEDQQGVFGETVQGTHLNNTLLIVDEVHNMLNGIINGSKSDLELYDLIMEAKNIKLVFLTGSPITNTPAELMPLFNMLSGSKLFGESFQDFIKAYVDVKRNTIKNKTKFQNRIFGLVSYYEAKGYEERFPEQKPIIVEKVPMSTKQYAAYSMARDKEIEEAARSYAKSGKAARMSKSKAKSSTYRIQTRQISNIHYPEKAVVKSKRSSELLTKEDLVDKIHMTSPKMYKIWTNCQEMPAHGVIYSQFVESGVGAYGKMLEFRGFKRIRTAVDLLEGKKTKDFRSFGILYGEADPEERSLIISIFNSPENKYGDVMMYLLLTASAVEGTDLKAGRHLHMMEPYWNWARTLQFFARLIRADSHAMLDKKERNVQPFIYLSDYPKDLPESRKRGPTTDVDIYEASRKNQRIINMFLKAIREVSIDCQIHRGDCRTCMPTNEKLFIDDMLEDLKTADSCKQVVNKKIKVKEIKTDLGTFYYSIDDGGKLHIFEKNKRLGGVVEIFSDHPHYDALYEKIAER